ncbi:MAG TPA: methyltransferase domain-containing protein [Chitinophagaceae bacterium]|nr:methyltransferase domain-containing protein [Chitinophagaceae bacterium]
MQSADYHKRIIEYYKDTENAYKDSWDLNNSLAIHYGYWDEKVNSFPESLLRMNEIMIETAEIKSTDKVLDAGCGVGGSSIFMATVLGCKVTGITLSERQVQQANENAAKKNVEDLVNFKAMDYSATDFPDASFDVVWGCESICYADDKEKFIKEAFRLLKPGGRLIVADGFVSEFTNNENPIIRQWADGWQVNYLESPERFKNFMQAAGFTDINYHNISKQASHSSRRLYRFYFLAKLYLLWKKVNFSKPATDMQKKNIMACKYQYKGMKKGLWQYGIAVGKKP